MITAEICQGRVNLHLNWLSNLCSENCFIQRIVTVLRFDWRKYSNAFYAMQPERTQQNEWISHAQVRYHRANQPTLWSRPDSVELCSDLDSSFYSVYFSTLSPFTYCKDYIVSLISFSRPQTQIKLINALASSSHIRSWMLIHLRYQKHHATEI